jgi:hypothetical protein
MQRQGGNQGRDSASDGRPAPGREDAPSELIEWARGAAPGDELVYAEGVISVRGSVAGVRAGALQAAGLVHLFQTGRPGCRNYHARRTSKPFAEARRLAPLARAAERRAEQETAGVLGVLKRAAQRGETCPSNGTIARIAGLSDKGVASYRIRCLQSAGLIHVDMLPAAPFRVVTILATGAATSAGAIERQPNGDGSGAPEPGVLLPASIFPPAQIQAQPVQTQALPAAPKQPRSRTRGSADQSPKRAEA